MLGSELAENQLCIEVTGGHMHTKLTTNQQFEAKHESSFWKELYMQAEGCDPFPLLRFSEIYRGSAQFWAPQNKKKHEQIEASPTEGHKDDEGIAASFIQEEGERAGFFICGRLKGILSMYTSTQCESAEMTEPGSTQ